ncbi:hypothetical protein ACH3Y9_12510 [Streptomyces sp. WSLK1-5]|uniref:hypothetical protein n=1 Tax=unclassified Streptomyces TaxID=2593676 RepID=UPI00378DAEA2
MIELPGPVVSRANDRVVIPFITARKGEEAAPANLYLLPQRGTGQLRLFYGDEDARDRSVAEMLWARSAFSMGDGGMPAGEPLWKFVHPYRQMATMLANCCEICTRPARTPLGLIFLAGPKDHDLTSPVISTWQPPVCARHVRTALKLCPHLEGSPMVCVARSAPLYGVIGTVYGPGPGGSVVAVEEPDEPVKFNDPRVPRTLASQLARRLASFQVLDVDEVLTELAVTA